MDRSLYLSLSHRASDLVDAGKHAQAIEVLRQLVDSDLPDFDKGVMCMNIATVHDKMGNRQAALQSYAEALDHECKTTSYFIAQQYAAYLSQLGLYADSIGVYQTLVQRTDLKAADGEMFRANILTLEGLARG
jgi:tetratricopeptide (TPR) repeat protein